MEDATEINLSDHPQSFQYTYFLGRKINTSASSEQVLGDRGTGYASVQD